MKVLSMFSIFEFVLRKIILTLIKGYQLLVSPLLGNCCRFTPTCSNYCQIAVEKYGVTKGLIKGFKRLAKCHPFHSGGIDLP